MEKALLVGVNLNNGEDYKLSLEELGSLAEACEMEVVGSVEQNLIDVHKAFYIGTGKVEEVKEIAEEKEADVVIFDNSLSPMQMRNLQDKIGKPILDRSTLILDIFASRARSREAKLQVEVARLQYMLPRLVGLHAALSRQGGGSGSMSNKGAGEKKLELDRRVLEHRLAEYRRELKEVGAERQTQRKKRAASGMPRIALVGYTNAGKSTLMNAMLICKWMKRCEEKSQKKTCFSLHDITVRKIYLRITMLSLIRLVLFNKSPQPGFHSMLEEAREADICYGSGLHDEHYKEQIGLRIRL